MSSPLRGTLRQPRTSASNAQPRQNVHGVHSSASVVSAADSNPFAPDDGPPHASTTNGIAGMTPAGMTPAGMTPAGLTQLLTEIMGPAPVSAAAARMTGVGPSTRVISSLPVAPSASTSNTAMLELQRNLCDARAQSARLLADKERVVAQHQSELAAAATVEDGLRTRVEKLERDRKFLFQREKETRVKLVQAEAQTVEARAAKDATFAEARVKLSEMSEELGRLRAELAASDREVMKQTIRDKDERLSKLELALTEANEVARSYADHARQFQAQLNAANQRLAESESANMQSTPGSVRGKRRRQQAENADCSEEDPDIERTLQLVSSQLSENIKYVKKLEVKAQRQLEELRVLRETKANAEAEREAHMQTQAQLREATKWREKYESMAVEHAVLQKERAEWCGYLEAGDDIARNPGIDTPHKVGRLLAAARIDAQLAADRVGRLQCEVTAKDADLQDAEEQLATAQVVISDLEAKVRIEQRQVARLTRTQVVLRSELEYSRKQIDSILSEDTATHNSDLTLQTRVEELQTLVDQYRSEIEAMSDEWKAESMTSGQKDGDFVPIGTKVRLDEAVAQNKALTDDIEVFKRDLMRKEKEADSLEQQLAALEHALGRGEYDRATTKVLQLKMNPAAEALAIRQEQLLALKNENQALLARLESLRGAVSTPNDAATSIEPGATIGDMVPFQSLENQRQENQRLHETIAGMEKRLLRLREVFQAKALEFREAVYSLLGYQLDFLANGRVRLTSGYAPTADASFVFSSGDDDEGTMQLVGGGNDAFVGDLEASIRSWVVEQGCIPGFLAEVTLRLIEERGAVMRDVFFDEDS